MSKQKIRVRDYRRVTHKEENMAKKSRIISYANIESLHENGLFVQYLVVRYKDRKYNCNCMSRLFRRRYRCKHIKAFIEYERRL